MAETYASRIKQSLDIKIQVIDDQERTAARWIGEDTLLVSVYARFECLCSGFLMKSLLFERHGTANARVNQ